jgi:hypothetical protein
MQMKAESRADEVAFLRIYPGENIQAFSLHKSFEDRTFAPVKSDKLPKVTNKHAFMSKYSSEIIGWNP